MTYNTTPRRRFTAKQREAFLEAHNHTCYWCEFKITPGQPWAIEHKTAREMLPDGRADEDDNLAPIHAHPAPCHKEKTKQDAALIAKSNRVRVKHGRQESRRTKPRPHMRSKGFDKTKTRRMDGTVTARKK